MTVGGTHIRVMATGIGWRGALLVALPLKDVDNALHSQLLLLALIAAGGILLAAVLGLLVARTALAPIAPLHARRPRRSPTNPDRIESDRLERRGWRRAGPPGPDLQPHAGRARASVQAQRNLVADASHELRTPIATIRANLQLMRDEELLSPEDRAGPAHRRDRRAR